MGESQPYKIQQRSRQVSILVNRKAWYKNNQWLKHSNEVKDIQYKIYLRLSIHIYQNTPSVMLQLDELGHTIIIAYPN